MAARTTAAASARRRRRSAGAWLAVGGATASQGTPAPGCCPRGLLLCAAATMRPPVARLSRVLGRATEAACFLPTALAATVPLEDTSTGTPPIERGLGPTAGPSAGKDAPAELRRGGAVERDRRRDQRDRHRAGRRPRRPGVRGRALQRGRPVLDVRRRSRARSRQRAGCWASSTSPAGCRPSTRTASGWPRPPRRPSSRTCTAPCTSAISRCARTTRGGSRARPIRALWSRRPAGSWPPGPRVGSLGGGSRCPPAAAS